MNVSETSRRPQSILFAGLLVFFAVLFLSCERDKESPKLRTLRNVSSDVIRIGEVVPLQGRESTFGTSVRNGVDMAIEQINANGGVQGKKVEILVVDDGGTTGTAVSAAKKLIQEDGVIAILGGVASSISIAMADVAQKNSVPMVSPSSTHPKVTEVGDYIFRVCFIDPFQGPVMARFARDELKAKRAAIIRDIKNEYSLGLASFFKERFVAMGGQIVSDHAYESGQIDFKPQLTALVAEKPDFIYLPGYYTEAALIIRQARKMGIETPFGGGDGWDSQKLKEVAGESLDGSFFSTHYSPNGKGRSLRQFVRAYQDRFKAVPDALAALGYDAAMVLVHAMQGAKSLEGGDLKAALAATKNFNGVTGSITLDSQRNAVKSAVIMKFEKGRQRFLKTIGP